MSTVFVDEKATWKVAIAAFICNFIIIGYLKACAILVIAYQEELGYPTSTLMVVVFANSALLGILAPLAELLCGLWTTRLVVGFAGIFLCFCCVLARFYLSEIVVIPLLGFAVGFGLSLCFCPSLSIINLCFEKRRTAAVGVCFSGASIGSMVMPVLTTFLIEQYTVRGCLLILGAINTNLCVAAILFPTKIRKRRGNEIILDQKLRCCCLSKSKGRPESVSVDSRRDDSISGSCQRVILYLLILVLSHFAYTTQFYAYPAYANEFEYGRYYISATLTVQGVMDLLLRIFGGFLIDRLNEAEKALTVGISVLVQGVGVLLLTWFMSRVSAMIYSAVFGLSGAVYMTVWSVVLFSIVGRRRFQLFISMALLLIGSINLCLGYLFGKVRDLMGSFHLAMQTCGIALTLAGLLTIAVLFPCFRKFSHRYSGATERPKKKSKQSKKKAENVVKMSLMRGDAEVIIEYEEN